MSCLGKGLVELWIKSHWPIRLHGFSNCSFSLTTWLFRTIIIDVPRPLEVLQVVLEIAKETLLLVKVYCIPGPLGTLIDNIILLTKELPTQNRISIVGDFNLDHMLPENVAKVDPWIQNFNLSQRSQYSTNIHGRLLDLVFDTLYSKLFLLYHHSTVIILFFIFQIWSLYSYWIQLSILITYKYLCWYLAS